MSFWILTSPSYKSNQFSYIQSIIPKSTSKKPIHDLLKGVKEIKKLREKAIANGTLAGDLTCQDDIKSSISIEIKVMKFHDVFLRFCYSFFLFFETSCYS